MSTRMLIDARHPEETRVAVLKGNRVEEFDFESAEHKQIKGNIYLAKVTRVEPSLQAAFVDFGGNRHGFLAFSEIHPDYYQIPKQDRDALLAEEEEHAAKEAELRAADEDAEDADAEEAFEAEYGGDDGDENVADDDESSDALAEDLADGGSGEELEEIDTSEKEQVATIEEGQLEDPSEEAAAEDEDEANSRHERSGRRGRRRGKGGARAKQADEIRAKRMALRRRYKIQDVIHRRQVLLVQVVKEERGNKGAALTTYLSLAGRYCVLMPNSSHGGGISRKISHSGDRKRLKQIVADLKLPRSMGLIVRTAGLKRTKTEIKRDFDYLARLWDEIREKTLSSSAPTLIHSDSDLIKRAIRDIYNRDIEEVIVEGEAGYRSAKEFMKLLMPSHARRVKAYSDPVPLFQRYGAEDQLRAMYDPVVQLKSGGYLVINPTEALVSIDINSGRSTKEHGIEATALSTNLEAAKEIARQLRLRDMAGLVVIDFIDMEHNSNTRKVERAMKDALKHDRARIQVGRISGFGLMEMSRQRLRTGVLEATTRECPHCDGSGLVRTASSASLSALRLVEDEAAKGRGTRITLGASTEAAIYLLNTKRSDLQEIERRYGVNVEVVPEGEDEGAKMSVKSSGPRPTARPEFAPIIDDDDDDEFEDDDAELTGGDNDNDDEPRKKKRRRRRGGRGRGRGDAANTDGENTRDDGDTEDGERGGDADDSRDHGSEQSDKETRAKSRRGRRGGRRRRRGDDNGDGGEQADEGGSDTAQQDGGNDDGHETEDKPKRKRASRAKADNGEDKAAQADGDAAGQGGETAESGESDKPKRKRSRKAPGSGAEKASKARTDAAEAASDAEGSEGSAQVKPRKRPARKAKSAQPESAEAGSPAEVDADAPAKAKPTRKRAPSKSAAVAKSSTEAPEDAKPGQGKAKAASSSENASARAASAKAETAKASSAASSDEATMANEHGGARRGWWQRTFGS